MQVFAEEICYKLHDILKDKKELQGVVHSVFNRVCNISFQNIPIVSLILKSIPMKPMAVSINVTVNMSMHELGIEAGQKVIYHHDKLEVPEAGLILYFSNSIDIQCGPSFSFNKENINRVKANIDELRLALKQGNPLGLLPIVSNFEETFGEQLNAIPQNRYSQFAWPRINKLILAVKQGEPIEITSASRGIAGFGPGLTPSSDDMLIGLMISFIYAAHYYDWEKGKAEAINEAILKGAEGRTNQLSYEMMSYAAQGEVIKNIHQLMNSIYFNTEQSLYKSALEVMNYGETSGADLLTGIYIGCKICANIKHKK